MSKRITNWFMLTLCCAAVMLAGMLLLTENGYAATGVRGTDISSPAPGYEFVLVEGDFSYTEKARLLNKVNEIRRNACINGEPDPRNRNRRLTINDYVPLRWSADLEWCAQTRAAEAALYDDHARPGHLQDISYGTASHNSEILAWSMTDQSADFLSDCIDNWMIEHNFWTGGNYSWGGHYAALINPRNTYCAFGGFVPEGCLFGAGCGLFSSQSGLNETQAGVRGKWLQVIEVRSGMMTVKKTQKFNVDKGKTKQAYLKGTSKYHNASTGDEDFEEKVTVYLMATGWKSKKPSIAKTDPAGNVRGKKTGKGSLYCTYNGKGYTVKVYVVNRKKVTPGKVKIKSVKANRKKMVIKWKRLSKKTKGYQVRLIDPTTGSVLASYSEKQRGSKTLSLTLWNIPKGKYKITVRAYNKKYGERYYGKWSKAKTVNVK